MVEQISDTLQCVLAGESCNLYVREITGNEGKQQLYENRMLGGGFVVNTLTSDAIGGPVTSLLFNENKPRRTFIHKHVGGHRFGDDLNAT